MSMFKPSMLTLALISAGVVSSNVALAQENDAASAEEQQKVEVIEVRGFRRSVAESINTKRFASEVVESISAEDIGKLPDSSIAESIARLPGLTAQRLDGRASRVSVRGFSENESATTFNGREQVSISDNRGVEFDLYPSEIMSGVTVYKTPSASIEAEGIAGVIDMQTVRPLSKGEQVIQFNGQYEQTSFDKLNPDGDDKGFRGTLSYIDQFADDTFGVAFAYTTMSSPNQEKRWNSWGYPDLEAPDGNTYSVLGGAKPFVRSSTLERDSAMLVLEYAPTSELNMTFDALYVDFSDEKILRGIEVPFAWGQGSIDPDSVEVDAQSGFITSAITEGQRVVVRNDFEERNAELTQFGFNVEYLISDEWSVEFDASRSEVERQVWSIESYSGTGRGDNNGVADDLGYSFNGGNTGAQFTHGLDYSDFNLIQLGGPLTWGYSQPLNEKYGLIGSAYENAAQDGFINAPEIEDELSTLKLAASKLLDNAYFNKVSFGISYRDREKSKLSEGYFMTLSSFSLDNPGMMMVPEQYRVGSANLDFIGMGDMIAYDTRALIDDGYYDLLQESLNDSKHKTRSWTVQEEVTAMFVQADINAELGDMPVTGNIGARYVKTEQSSQGFEAATVDGQVVATPIDVSHDYSHFLPSVNLNVAITDDQTIRFGAAKTISRARLDEMNSSVAISYNATDKPDENGNFWSVSGGNTKLEPKEAVGFDLSYENYFSAEGYFSTAIFYKDLKEWTFDETYFVDMGDRPDPATGIVPPADRQTASRSSKINGGGGDLWGYELSVALPFNLFADELEGFGLLASHTGVEQDIEDQNGNEYELPGLSDSIQSLTLYYDRYGFSARTSMRKRSDFKGDVYGPGFATNQVAIQGETIWDAQIGYDFGESGIAGLEGLEMTFQVQNITEEPFVSLQGDNSLQVRDYQDYGRTYLLGFKYEL
ncbi:TonB-dependent receptor [Pseudoalteromonas sp. BDTF-M6]|uniref:TonB-dependent receptor n=1 Tax=Pseudoalteromonas sp. BDTF-M6 TaxID=2796132 RepID=UPI001BB0BC55|nr:TonB-dependent receptor [Pseudoalteromonas sp. BDTF-M6]MBS3796495.1 TonB-dependent receptor [Pseudoalteromonas sp. BDTF-M6]